MILKDDGLGDKFEWGCVFTPLTSPGDQGIKSVNRIAGLWTLPGSERNHLATGLKTKLSSIVGQDNSVYPSV